LRLQLCDGHCRIHVNLCRVSGALCQAGTPTLDCARPRAFWDSERGIYAASTGRVPMRPEKLEAVLGRTVKRGSMPRLQWL
jgi:hypothetical protein